MIRRVEAERILTDMKRKLLKKMSEDDLALLSSDYSQESETTSSEDSVIAAVQLALPEERLRIQDLLAKFPKTQETKVQGLLDALGNLWAKDPKERVVIFATYLGSVEMLGEQIEQAYPGQGVVVLKGGDHGSKAAAEKRFKLPDGPRVMICTAAGREGINLQHARILFNFDLLGIQWTWSNGSEGFTVTARRIRLRSTILSFPIRSRARFSCYSMTS